MRLGEIIDDWRQSRPLALDFGVEAISLFTRDPEADWRRLGAVELADEAFQEKIRDLARLARAEAGGVAVDVWLPEDQILNRELALEAANALTRRGVARRILAERANVRAADIGIDLAPLEDGGWAISAVERIVVREAAAYARKWGFHPKRITTSYANPAFAVGPDFRDRAPRRKAAGAAGVAVAVVAAMLLWPGETAGPDPEPRRIVLESTEMAIPPLPEDRAGPPQAERRADLAPAADRPAPAAGEQTTEAQAGPANDPPMIATAPPAAPSQPRPPAGGMIAVGADPTAPPARPPNAGPPVILAMSAPQDFAAGPFGAAQPVRLVPARVTAAVEAMASPRRGAAPASARRVGAAVPAAPPQRPAAAPAPDTAPDPPAGVTPAAPEATDVPSIGPGAMALLELQDSGRPLIGLGASGDAPEREPGGGASLVPRPGADAPRPGAPDATAKAPPKPEDAPVEVAEAPVAGEDAAGPGALLAAPAPTARPKPPEEPAATEAPAIVEASEQAALAAPTPRARPSWIKPKPRALAARNAEIIISPALGRPTRASVGRYATVSDALPLEHTSMLGVFGKPGKRRAILRMPDGEVRRVAKGENVDGWTVTGIEATSMRLSRGGETRQLNLIR